MEFSPMHIFEGTSNVDCIYVTESMEARFLVGRHFPVSECGSSGVGRRGTRHSLGALCPYRFHIEFPLLGMDPTLSTYIWAVVLSRTWQDQTPHPLLKGTKPPMLKPKTEKLVTQRLTRNMATTPFMGLIVWVPKTYLDERG